jgi:hypothetical protein
MAELDVLQVCVDTVKNDVVEIKNDIKEMDKKISLTYLTLVQYEADIRPIRSIVFGLVGLILIAVVSALIYLVINKGGTP